VPSKICSGETLHNLVGYTVHFGPLNATELFQALRNYRQVDRHALINMQSASAYI